MSLNVDDTHIFVDVDTLGGEKIAPEVVTAPCDEQGSGGAHKARNKCFYTLQDIRNHTIAKTARSN